MPLTESQKEEVREKADLAQKNAKKLNNSVRYAISEILPNTLNGCFWGFTNVESLQGHIKAIQDEDRLVARKLADNNVILEVDPKLLIESVQMIDKNAFTVEDARTIREAQKTAEFEFEKYLIDKGKKEGGFEGIIGIYCINKVACITLKGIQYRAFRVNMKQTLSALSRFNYLINVKGKYIEPYEAVDVEKDLWASTILSPSQTGVFIKIKYNSTVEAMLELEKPFKKKYSLS